MIFLSSNYDDISRYYKGTYVKFKDTGDKLFYIRNVHRDSITGCDEDGTEFELYLNDTHPYEVDYILPSKSFFQYAKRAVLLQRIPAKQYQRGISGNNVKLVSLTKTGGLSTMDMGFEVLKAFVSKQNFWSLDEAVRNKGRMISIALTPRIAYIPEAGYIFVDTTAVARVDKKDKTIYMLASIFSNELNEIACNSSFKVV